MWRRAIPKKIFIFVLQKTHKRKSVRENKYYTYQKREDFDEYYERVIISSSISSSIIFSLLCVSVLSGDSSSFGSFDDFSALGHDHQRSHDRPLVDADAR